MGYFDALPQVTIETMVTMEVILWTVLWNEFEGEFDNEKNLLGGSLGEKAAEDLKQRVIEHVSFIYIFFNPSENNDNT